jgi:hypothetical protein
MPDFERSQYRPTTNPPSALHGETRRPDGASLSESGTPDPPDLDGGGFPAAWVDALARSLHSVICRAANCRDLPSFHVPARVALADLAAVGALVTPLGKHAEPGDDADRVAARLHQVQALLHGDGSGVALPPYDPDVPLDEATREAGGAP